jgi:signal transduction histidine kinase
MVVAAVTFPRWAIALLALVCSLLTLLYDSSASRLDAALYFMFSFISYLCSAFFIAVLFRNHTMVVEHLKALEEEQALRREAEEQLTTLVKSSPAGILTVDECGSILGANEATHELFDVPEGEALTGRQIGEYLPVLADALQIGAGTEPFRTAAQCQGRKRNGEIFLAHIWFSTYRMSEKTRLSAIVIDASEEMRDREEQGLKQLSRSIRVTAAAVSHEIRNFCVAISLFCSDWKRRRPSSLQELERLETLIQGLERIATLDLRSRAHESVPEIPLQQVFDDLRILIEPDWREIEGLVRWEQPPSNLRVIADSHGLLQAFLNLARNSHRGVTPHPVRMLTISVSQEAERATVRFRDTGPGVSDPARLFQPFQEGADVNGMGLYVSRAILRSYGGELRYEREAAGACFAVELQAVRDGDDHDPIRN